jgi:hypothetical protein
VELNVRNFKNVNKNPKVNLKKVDLGFNSINKKKNGYGKQGH